MDETLSYIDLVYKVLNSWYIKLAEVTPRLTVGILVFLFFLTFSKYLSKLSVNVFHKVFPSSRRESVTTLVGVFRFLIMIMGTFISLEIMGFSGFFIKFLGSLGVAGVIAGVALKDLVSSIFSGMLIGIDKAFKVGDYVTIGNNSGSVIEIGLLTTKIITDDGRKVYIPNQVIFNQPFFNVTASPQRRIILDFEIPADEDISKAKNSAFTVIRQLENIDRLDAADVVFTSLKQGAFTLQVRFWIKVGSNVTTAKSDALMQIKKQFDTDGVHLVTPTSISITNNDTENN